MASTTFNSVPRILQGGEVMAKTPVKRGGGQSKPTTPSGTRKTWQPPTQGTAPADRPRIRDMGKWCPATGIVRACCQCWQCRAMWHYLEAKHGK